MPSISGGFQSRIAHGVADRDGCKRPRRPVRAAGKVSLANADDGVLVAQEFWRGGVDVFPGLRHFLKTPDRILFVPWVLF